MKLLAKHFVLILVYIGYFTVQMGSNFVIQENIRAKQDHSALQSTHANQKHIVGVFKQIKHKGNLKKSQLNKRFCPSSNNEVLAFNANASLSYIIERTISISNSVRLQKSNQSNLEDRGPPQLMAYATNSFSFTKNV